MSIVNVSIDIDPSNQAQREALEQLLNTLDVSDPGKEVPVKKKTTEKKVVAKKASEPKEEAAVEAKLETEQIKIEAVRAVLATKVTEHREVIKKKLTELEANNVTALAVDKYPAFLEFLNSL